jgi:hypothetical protein
VLKRIFNKEICINKLSTHHICTCKTFELNFLSEPFTSLFAKTDCSQHFQYLSWSDAPTLLTQLCHFYLWLQWRLVHKVHFWLLLLSVWNSSSLIFHQWGKSPRSTIPTILSFWFLHITSVCVCVHSEIHNFHFLSGTLITATQNSLTHIHWCCNCSQP